ncbi:MAG: pirin [Burkholderiales bacterium]|jgi:redox-sensitive bicupin YhaK (pirin superfamily)|nr:pirin [Burkholderiales bacterium]
MLYHHLSHLRGVTTTSWLDSKHSFSFGRYYNPNFIDFGKLKVINEDVIAPMSGFPPHSHNNMEILTYVTKGTLTHKDSLGNSSNIMPGEIQIMSAGQGIMHSEYNNSPTESVHLLQIWISPNMKNLIPSYQQKKIDFRKNELILIASSNSQRSAVMINQDVSVYVGFLSNAEIEFSNKKENSWLQMIKGEANLNGIKLSQGDGIGIIQEEIVTIEATNETEFLLFSNL